MYWQEHNPEPTSAVPDDVVDVIYAIACRSLPVDHSYALSQAVVGVLPWLLDEPGAGIHAIHVAESGNGWIRPENAGDLLHLSRRTKLALRLPAHRVEAARTLVGQILDVGSYRLEIKSQIGVRRLSDITTIFARYVVTDNAPDEAAFLDGILGELASIGVRPTKMLPGRVKIIMTPEAPLATRSLLLADLSLKESVTLQQHGLGPHRHLGCGLFLPHKGIAPVPQPPR